MTIYYDYVLNLLYIPQYITILSLLGFGFYKFIKKRDLDSIEFVYLVLLSFLILQSLRNVSTYGLESFGELKYSFSYIFPFLALKSIQFRDKDLKIFCKRIIYFSIILIPIVIIFKDWSITLDNFRESTRIYPASVSASILFSSFIYFTKEKNLNWYKYIIAILIALLILIDGHRSVWLCGIIIIAYSIFRRPSINKFILGVFVLFITALTFKYFGFDEYLIQRAEAFFNPTSDRTSNWRLLMWESYILAGLNQPILGTGFGAMWYTYIQNFGFIPFAPHNLYVSLFYKTGLIGLLLFMSFLVITFSELVKYEAKLILIASLIFYLFYSLNYFTWFLIPLSLYTRNSRIIYDSN